VLADPQQGTALVKRLVYSTENLKSLEFVRPLRLTHLWRASTKADSKTTRARRAEGVRRAEGSPTFKEVLRPDEQDEQAGLSEPNKSDIST